MNQTLREAQRQADQDALSVRSVLAAEASARWAKWSMVIAGLALVVAIAALLRAA